MKLKGIRKKNDDNTFSELIPIEVKGENVDLEEGITLEEKLNQLKEEMANFQTTLVWEEM